jgi:hypothetical protein
LVTGCIREHAIITVGFALRCWPHKRSPNDVNILFLIPLPFPTSETVPLSPSSFSHSTNPSLFSLRETEHQRHAEEVEARGGGHRRTDLSPDRPRLLPPQTGRRSSSLVVHRREHAGLQQQQSACTSKPRRGPAARHRAQIRTRRPPVRSARKRRPSSSAGRPPSSKREDNH